MLSFLRASCGVSSALFRASFTAFADGFRSASQGQIRTRTRISTTSSLSLLGSVASQLSSFLLSEKTCACTQPKTNLCFSHRSYNLCKPTLVPDLCMRLPSVAYYRENRCGASSRLWSLIVVEQVPLPPRLALEPYGPDATRHKLKATGEPHPQPPEPWRSSVNWLFNMVVHPRTSFPVL